MVRTIALVSLSRGLMGEEFIKHEVELGLKRLAGCGCEVRFMPHALSGLEYIDKHPEDRAQDLLDALQDDSIDMILCAIGGDDTYRLAPYLLEGDRLKKAVKPKVFLGYSDTTWNHFMLNSAGMNTFYGQAFLPDICELAPEMLPYTRQYFEELLSFGSIRRVTPSPVWYESRTDFSERAVGTCCPSHKSAGFELIQGPARFSGRILGGCADSLLEFFDTERYPDMAKTAEKYHLFPDREEWKDRILLLETSEELMPPADYRRLLHFFKERGIFDNVSGVLCGKPMDDRYHAEYKAALKEVINDPDLPVLCNLNIGHAAPRCILPFGMPAEVDAEKQVITFAG